MNKEVRLKYAIGSADMCELLSRVFSFPDEALVEACLNGALRSDFLSCLTDVGLDPEKAFPEWEALTPTLAPAADDLFAELRRSYSLCYLTPGSDTPVSPYESPFLHKYRGAKGSPVLFRSPVTLDVEKHMREAGVVAKNGRKEPCDSMYEEFEFLSYLYAQLASAIYAENSEQESLWVARIEAFLDEHFMQWAPQFMEETKRCNNSGFYQHLASLALLFIADINEDFRRMEGKVS